MKIFENILSDLFHSLPWWIYSFFAAIIVAKVLRKKYRHLPKIIKSYNRLKKLRSIENPGQQFGYLRCIDPFVFEEMILTAFKKMGFKIIRNLKYSGDGGIDGRIVVDGKVILIQAKRYKSHINPRHVTDFATVCQKHGCRGLFIHTGKTGIKSRQNTSNIVDIVSGERMLNLLNLMCFESLVFGKTSEGMGQPTKNYQPDPK